MLYVKIKFAVTFTIVLWFILITAAMFSIGIKHQNASKDSFLLFIHAVYHYPFLKVIFNQILTLQKWMAFRKLRDKGRKFHAKISWPQVSSRKTHWKCLLLSHWWPRDVKSIAPHYPDTLTRFSHKVSMTTQQKGWWRTGRSRWCFFPYRFSMIKFGEKKTEEAQIKVKDLK